jgi:D-alanyl-D-alanine carboxypeptidase/D-alanyl-D-alanine-endopeptidase (penicillin-binding protein 4)
VVGALLLLAPRLQAQESTLETRIQQLINSMPEIGRAHLGYEVVDLDSKTVLASQLSNGFFTPASNDKLYTTALALDRLGPDYRFITELRMDPQRGLQLVGGGDPNLSGRVLPYNVAAKDGDPLAVLRGFAETLWAAGIRAIDGDVSGVSSRYPHHLYPSGWELNDTLYGYGAPVTALALNDNTVTLLLHPTGNGDLADIQTIPAFPHLIILNTVLTSAGGRTKLHVDRQPGSNELTISGSIATTVPELRADVAVDDPALFAAEALVDVLRDQGITVQGEARADYVSQPSGVIVASHQSAPLSQIVQIINKVSQNLHAEMLLDELQHVDPALTRDTADFSSSDGSGLARQDLVTPDATISLLERMWEGGNRDLWLQSLPIGGVDGTLQHRFHDIPGADRIHAKTGSLTHVNALSGYVETPNGKWLAFSVLVDQTLMPDREVREFLDRFAAALLRVD